MSMLSEKEFNKDKEKDFSEWYNTIIYAADLVDNRYNVQGFVVHKPWSMLSFKKLYALFEKELEKDGHLPSLFPTVVPEENFEIEKKHAEGFIPEVFWITQRGAEKLERKLALRPTSETIMYPMYSLWIRDHTDLPLKLYQSCNMFRNESETSPFLRGREFLWIEAHDVFTTKKESEEQVMKDSKISKKVLDEFLGLSTLIFQRPKWDTFPGAEYTYATDVLLADGKALQIASTHLLGQNFAKAFNVKFKDSEGKEHLAWQTCYGPGIWRIMAAIISIHGDNKGLIFPPVVAPINVVVVPITRSKEDSTKIMEYSKKVVEKLKEEYSVEFDTRNKTPGFKYAHWELKGVPVRVEIGGREVENETVTLSRRDVRDKKTIKLSELMTSIKELNEDITQNLKKNADENLKSHIKNAETTEELSSVLNETKGYARVNFHSLEMDGKDCADSLQHETKGGKVRGILIDKKEKPFGNKKCIMCGSEAKHVVYVAKQY